MSVQPARDGGGVDLMLCARTPVGVLLPAVVDVLGHTASPPGPGWRLDRLAGGPLAEALSLRDNGIEDGDALVLADVDTPTTGPVGRNPERVVAVTAADPAGGWAWRLRQAASTCAALVATILLTCDGTRLTHLGIALVGAGATSWIAVSTRSTAVALSGCALAAAAGFAAVPSAASVANVFLAACATVAVAAVLTALWPAPCAALTATGWAAALSACATASALFASLPAATVGTVLAVLALVVLAAAPRVSAVVAWQDRGEAAHVLLSGLVCGCAAGAALGVGTLAWQCGRAAADPVACGAFGVVTGLCLLLRIRTYVDGPRRLALLGGGLSCLAAVVVATGVAHPGSVAWTAPAVLAAGWVGLRQRWPAVAGRAADLGDYATMAAVPVLACWVIGVYDWARNWTP